MTTKVAGWFVYTQSTYNPSLPIITSHLLSELYLSSQHNRRGVKHFLSWRMSSRPPSPIKKTFQKFLSPSKQNPSAAPSPSQPTPSQFPLQGTTLETNEKNLSYSDSTLSTSSGSQYSCSSSGNAAGLAYSGWNVIDTPHSTHHNKENVNLRPSPTKSFVDQVMGRTHKLSKQNKHLPQENDLDRQFEELMVSLTWVKAN